MSKMTTTALNGLEKGAYTWAHAYWIWKDTGYSHVDNLHEHRERA
jgi:hypothetical protein